MKLGNITLTALTAILLVACVREQIATTATPQPTPSPTDIAAMRAATDNLQERLLFELTDSIGARGVAQSVEVCGSVAMLVGSMVSMEEGFSVGRTALKTRNPDNAPEPDEMSIMARWQSAIAAGTDPASLEHAAFIETDHGPAMRYMRPIVMQQMCTACHGGDLAPDVQAKITALYPEDQATGFTPGEFRGAFTVTKPVE